MANSEPFEMAVISPPADIVFEDTDVVVRVSDEMITIDYQATGTTDVAVKRHKDGSQ